MMDPHFRSITGFQSLVQKEWVAMGHPFTSRHHLISPQPTSSPVESGTEDTPVEVNMVVELLECLFKLAPLSSPGSSISPLPGLCLATDTPVSFGL